MYTYVFFQVFEGEYAMETINLGQNHCVMMDKSKLFTVHAFVSTHESQSSEIILRRQLKIDLIIGYSFHPDYS
jgi:hypothetical protein